MPDPCKSRWCDPNQSCCWTEKHHTEYGIPPLPPLTEFLTTTTTSSSRVLTLFVPEVLWYFVHKPTYIQQTNLQVPRVTLALALASLDGPVSPS